MTDESITVVKKFEMSCGEVEFTKAEDLSAEEKKKIGVNEGLVVVERAFNPGVTFLPVKDNDFVGFLQQRVIDNGKIKELNKPFNSFV